LKNPHVFILRTCEAGDEILLPVKSTDLRFRATQERDLQAQCSSYSSILEFTVDRIEVLLC